MTDKDKSAQEFIQDEVKKFLGSQQFIVHEKGITLRTRWIIPESKFVCPKCEGQVNKVGTGYECSACSTAFTISETDIPVEKKTK